MKRGFILNKLLAKIIDKYALYQFHREKSTVSHFSNTGIIPALEEHNHFYFKPQYPDVVFENMKEHSNYKTGAFKYKSEIENEKCNEYVRGVFYENKVNSPLNVVLVHGWTQDNERIKEIYLKPFIEQGYNIYFMTLPYHTERQSPNSLYNGEFMVSANIERTLSSMRQAVVDIRALINWLKSMKGKVVLVGISLGGLVVNLTTTVEENIDGSISVFAPNELSYTIWNNIPGKYIKKDLKENAFTYCQLKTCWDITNTSNFAIKIPKEKVLILSALYDRYIDFRDADKLWEAWERPERKLYHCGHAGIALCKRSIANNSLEFIKRYVLGEVH
jgi:dienelactone hydrolase